MAGEAAPGGPATDGVRAAEHDGRVCAVAMDCQRDLQRCAETYPELFPRKPFDARLFDAVGLANAFGSPWATADRLRIATRTSLWVFAADWVVDYVAKSRDEVDEVVGQCLAVADGAPPVASVPLTRFLADLGTELASAPAFEVRRHTWRAQLERYLESMRREWEWKTARTAGGATALPTFEQYLDNAHNFGSLWVNVSHWIHTADPATLDHFDRLWDAGEAVQRVLRLLNDLATHERDVEWGDLNALMLGVDRAGVTAHIAALVERCGELIRPLKGGCDQQAVYLERQIGYSTGFYGLTDYWGSL